MAWSVDGKFHIRDISAAERDSMDISDNMTTTASVTGTQQFLLTAQDCNQRENQKWYVAEYCAREKSPVHFGQQTDQR